MKRKALKVHSAAKLLPSMSTAQFAELRADIEKNGLVEPIWLCEGKILDGRNRERACRELGIEVRTQDYTGDDPEGFVVSVNLVRRHLTAKQKRGLITRLLHARPDMSTRQVAAATQSAQQTVKRLREGANMFAPERLGADGKRYPVRPTATEPTEPRALRPSEVPLSTIITAKDLEYHRFFKFLSTVHPSELTDAPAKIEQMQTQVDRIRALADAVAADSIKGAS